MGMSAERTRRWPQVVLGALLVLFAAAAAVASLVQLWELVPSSDAASATLLGVAVIAATPWLVKRGIGLMRGDARSATPVGTRHDGTSGRTVVAYLRLSERAIGRNSMSFNDLSFMHPEFTHLNNGDFLLTMS